jgi:hypothetical protein
MARRFVFGVCTSALLAASLASGCRDFDASVEEKSANDMGGDGGEAGRGDPPNAGGTPAAGTAASAGAGFGQGGQAGASAGAGPFEAAASGAAGAESAHPEEATLGAVRLLINGIPVCGGTLVTNSWIVTADQCLPPKTAGVDVEVTYGRNSATPYQRTTVSEVVRFGSNDGSVEGRGRDVVLLGTKEPINVGGKDNGFWQPIYSGRDMSLASTQTCIGWDLSPSTDQGSGELRAVELDPIGVDFDTTIRSSPTGDLIWIANSNPYEPTRGDLPTINDVGTGCFITANEISHFTTLNLEPPAHRRDGSVNVDLEAVGLALAETPIRSWIDQALYAPVDHLPLPPLGPPLAAWSGNDKLEVIGVSLESGSLMSVTRIGGDWGLPVDLGAPDAVPLSKSLRPGGVWRPSGEVEIAAVGEDGSLWWKRKIGQWLPWQRIDVAKTRITSGVKLGEKAPRHFHLVARGEEGELRHAEYKGGWLNEWRELAPSMIGEPALDVTLEGRANIFFASDDGLWQANLFNDQWPVYFLGAPPEVASPPAIAAATLNVFDLVGRSPAGTLTRQGYRGWWDVAWLDSAVPMPDADPVAVARTPGELDVFASESDGSIWHVSWPRLPKAPP